MYLSCLSFWLEMHLAKIFQCTLMDRERTFWKHTAAICANICLYTSLSAHLSTAFCFLPFPRRSLSIFTIFSFPSLSSLRIFLLHDKLSPSSAPLSPTSLVSSPQVLSPSPLPNTVKHSDDNEHSLVFPQCLLLHPGTAALPHFLSDICVFN